MFFGWATTGELTNLIALGVFFILNGLSCPFRFEAFAELLELSLLLVLCQRGDFLG